MHDLSDGVHGDRCMQHGGHDTLVPVTGQIWPELLLA